MLVVFRGHDDRLGFRFVEHLDVIAEELNARRHTLPSALDQFRVRVGDGDKFRVRFLLDVAEQAPDVVVIESDDRQTGLCRLRDGKLREKQNCGG